MAVRTTQPELLPKETPKSLREFWKSRLPVDALLNISDVANAMNVSADKVREWCDAELLDCCDIGTADKPYWKIYRPSVIRLIDDLTREVFSRPGGNRR